MSPSSKILNEEFLKPLGLTANAVAKPIDCPNPLRRQTDGHRPAGFVPTSREFSKRGNSLWFFSSRL